MKISHKEIDQLVRLLWKLDYKQLSVVVAQCIWRMTEL
jgi:hypothetical protein